MTENNIERFYVSYPQVDIDIKKGEDAKMKKIILSLLLSFCLVFIATPLMAAMPFTDVKTSDWFYDEVQFVYDNKLFNGMTDTTFEPNTGMSRAMFVTVLGRIVGIDPDDYYGDPFDDVDYGDWYRKYVIWAYETGIVNGVGNNLFAPNDLVTREQMATIIANYVDKSGVGMLPAENPVAGFNDSFSVSSWARDGLELMRVSGIIVGDQNGNFNPKATTTRAEAATVFQRLYFSRITDECNIRDAHIKIKDSYISYNDEGKKVLVVRVDFTNYGEELSFTFATIDYAFQNSIELDSCYDSSVYESGYNSDNTWKKVRAGGCLEIQLSYELQDDTPVTVEIQDLVYDTGFKAVKTFYIK